MRVAKLRADAALVCSIMANDRAAGWRVLPFVEAMECVDSEFEAVNDLIWSAFFEAYKTKYGHPAALAWAEAASMLLDGWTP